MDIREAFYLTCIWGVLSLMNRVYPVGSAFIVTATLYKMCTQN
jgi:hypothetical protein